MLDKFKKIFSADADNTAKAETEEEVLSMTETKELPELSAGANTAELTAALATSESALTTLQSSFAELNNKYTEAATKLAAIEAEKADLVAKAAEAKLAARKEKLELAVGDVKAAVLLTTLESLDDNAFGIVVESMTVNLDAEAKSALFVEAGVTAEAAEIKPTHFKDYIKKGNK